VVYGEGKQFNVLIDADEAILYEHFYRDVFKDPKPTKKQETTDASTEHQTEESLVDGHPL
jgi:hypothetical protein